MTEFQRTTMERSIDERVDPRSQAQPDRGTLASTQRTVVWQRADAYVSGWTRLARLVKLLFGILQATLILRIVLLLLGADRANDIVAGILGATAPFVEPFRGMFSPNQVSAAAGSTLDVAALAALIGWSLLELLVLAAIRLADRRAGLAA